MKVRLNTMAFPKDHNELLNALQLSKSSSNLGDDVKGSTDDMSRS